MERVYGYTRILTTGAPAPNATVTVYNTGTLVLATVYADNLANPTPLANPFTSDANGYFFFYATGRFDIQFSGGGIPSPYTWGDVADGGILSLNGMTGDSQLFLTGTSGIDFNISSSLDIHTFNLPDASATARGAVTTLPQSFAGAKTFLVPIAAGSGGTGFDGSLAAQGALPIGNGAGFTLATITGTANQVIVTNAAGSITLSGPQALGTVSTPTFTGLILSGLAPFAVVSTDGVSTLAATALLNGQLLIGSTGVAPVAATLTAGSNISIAQGAGSITISCTSVIGTLNGLTDAVQSFATATTGTDFTITSAAGVHTFAIPDASSANRGLVTNAAQTLAGQKTFSTQPLFNTGGSAGTTIVSGRLSTNFTAAVNAGAAETDLMTYSLAANTLNSTGKVIHVRCSGTTAANANVKTIKFYFGATLVSVWSTATLNASKWTIDAWITATGAATEYMSVTGVASTATPTPSVTDATPAEAVAGAITIKVTGQGTAGSDVTQNLMIVMPEG